MAVTLAALRSADAALAAELHRAAFPGFFLSSLGTRFLTEFYRGFINEPTAVTVAAHSVDGLLVGAAVGTTDPEAFFRRLVRRRFVRFFAAAAVAALRAPNRSLRLLRAARYRGVEGAPQAPGALLSSIWVAPEAQDTGIGRLLLGAWLDSAASAGAERAYLTTDAAENASVNEFYTRNGWTLTSTYATKEGRQMNVYTAPTHRQSALGPGGTSGT